MSNDDPCGRCQGDGMVITYQGRPLWMGSTLGRQRLHEIANGQHTDAIRACSEPRKALRLFFAAKATPSEFLPTACPDCTL